jgi:serine phosphatase RsbU (regulator of sigma subunit)
MMNRILNTGVSDVHEDSLNRKIRILNLVSVITILFMSVFGPMALVHQIYSIALLDFLFLFITAGNFFLHRKGRFRLSFWLSSCFGAIYFTGGTIIYGLQANMHFYLLIMCMIAIVLFDRLVVIRTYLGLVTLLFLALLLYMKDHEGLVVLSPERAKVQGMINIIILFSFFLITLTFFLFFKKDNFRYQKAIVEQKKLVQEKQKEIIDSINYAKRIQEALMPAPAYWDTYLPDSFVFYKPKDIVAGDFYWMETVQNGELLFFAIGDCTGHGVPGAMVSVVCSNALNRSLLEFGLTGTAEILDKTRELVIATFRKSSQEVKDGMDISLCRLNTRTRELEWSGANNPLWYIRKGEKDLSKILPDKQPVGEFAQQTPFTAHRLNLAPGDLLYMFSDGYADQFGGLKGKKYKYKQLEDLLVSLAGEPMPRQKQQLNDHFEAWRGQLEQLDDVCVLGIRIH